MTNIVTELEYTRLRQFEHVQRLDGNWKPKSALEYKPRGIRRLKYKRNVK